MSEDLRSRTAHLPVTFLGAQTRPQVAEAMRRASVLVIPSRNEGWPTVINEAFAAGTAVAATDVGGVVKAIGRGTWVVPADPAPEAPLADLVADLLIADIDRSALRTHAAQYSWAAIASLERQAMGLADG